MAMTSPVAFIWVPSVRLAVDELVKGPLGNLHHHVVQRRLKAGAGLAGDGVFDLVQGVAQGDLGGHLGDGVAGGLGGQGGGAGHPGVDLDDRVLKAVRIEGKLAVAAALDAHGGDDVEGPRFEASGIPCRRGSGRGRPRWSRRCGRPPGRSSPWSRR